MANPNERRPKGIQRRIRLSLVSPNAAVQRRRAARTSAARVHNEVAHVRRARDDVSPSAPTACYTLAVSALRSGWGSSISAKKLSG
jgi:hypothetical protein